MKRLALALLVLIGSFPVATAVGAEPPVRMSPPGQVKIVTVNAHQNGILGIKRFENMYELSFALRRRPAAFDGGYSNGVAAPGVIVVQEMRTTNTEIFTRLMRQRFQHKYQIVGPDDAVSQIIYDPEAVTPQGEPETWTDDCAGVVTGGNKTGRIYQLARFIENRSGAAFSVVAIHLKKNYESTGEEDCYQRNAALIGDRVRAETDAVFVAGDFNRRPVQDRLFCDEREASAEQPWYRDMTDPTDGLGLTDTARSAALSEGRSMATQWTHEQKRRKPTGCGGRALLRNRIDYIFARGARVAEAGADDPGWAGEKAGTVADGEHRYSDHRFVWARLVLEGPGRPEKPGGSLEKGGAVRLNWAPVPGATEYLIYRAVADHGASRIAKVPASTTTFTDLDTRHGFNYLYSVAASNGDGQGVESRPVSLVPDAKGPRIKGFSPADGARGVDPRTMVTVDYNEDVLASSVGRSTISLFLGNSKVRGRVTQIGVRTIRFNPRYPLKKGKTYRLEIKPVQDSLGNVGGARYDIRFSIKAKRRSK